MARKASLAKLVYGRRDPEPENVTDVTVFQGRKPKASRCITRKLNRTCDCGRPLRDDDTRKTCSFCLARRNRKPAHADSLMEAAVYADPRSRMTIYRAKGRLA